MPFPDRFRVDVRSAEKGKLECSDDALDSGGDPFLGRTVRVCLFVDYSGYDVPRHIIMLLLFTAMLPRLQAHRQEGQRCILCLGSHRLTSAEEQY